MHSAHKINARNGHINRLNMRASSQQHLSPFSGCKQASIEDPLLEALITNKWRKEYPNINPITSGLTFRKSTKAYKANFASTAGG
jgi:hypothetical protein